MRREFSRALGCRMRYFFHTVGPSYEDDNGSRFAQEKDAVAHATVIASQLADDDGFAGYSILVVDEEGNEIARIPIATG